jgi:adenosylcobinamide kinase/adenosylcobinamide-phosphate guanylyltransferase
MWILNHLDDDIEVLLAQLDSIMSVDADVVMVLNDVGLGVIPIDAQSRRFVDYSGMVGQHLARLCDEVYEVKLGLEIRLK